MSEITQEDVVQSLGNMSVIQLISLTKDLEKLWGVEAKPQMVQMLTVPTVEVQQTVQTEFILVINSVPADKKISVIKTVRELLGLTLLDSKAMLDGLPKTVKEGLTKDEADQLRTRLVEAGAVVEVK